MSSALASDYCVFDSNTDVLLVMFCADRDLISYTASTMPIVSLYLLLDGVSVRTLLLLLLRGHSRQFFKYISQVFCIFVFTYLNNSQLLQSERASFYHTVQKAFQYVEPFRRGSQV